MQWVHIVLEVIIFFSTIHKLQYFGHLIWRADSLEKTLMLGKIEGRRRRGWQRMRWVDGIIDSMDMSLTKFRETWRKGKPGVLQSTGLQRVGHNLATEQQHTRGKKDSFTCFVLFFFFFWLHFVLCKILVPWPGIKTMLLALEFRSLNHWTATEVPKIISFKNALSGQ